MARVEEQGHVGIADPRGEAVDQVKHLLPAEIDPPQHLEIERIERHGQVLDVVGGVLEAGKEVVAAVADHDGDAPRGLRRGGAEP